MNQEDFLDMLKQSQNLINGSIVSTDLNSILIGFCDIIIHQNKEIESLKDRINKMEKAEEGFSLMKLEFETKSMLISQIQNQLAVLANQTQAELIKSRQEMEIVKLRSKEYSEDVLQKLSELENSVDNQIHSFSLQNTHNEEKVKNSIDEFARQNEKLEYDLHDMKIELTTFLQEQKQSQIEIQTNIDSPKPQPVEIKNVDFDQTVIDDIRNQISSIEKKIEENQNVISEVHFGSQKFINEIKMSEKRIQKIIDDETNFINDRVGNLEKQFQSVPEIHDLILSGKEIGLKPILQAIMRDSRRLDSFDQQVSNVRIECENVARGMVSLSEKVQQFNNLMFDFSREVKSNSSKIILDIKSVKRFCKFLGKTVNNMVTDISKITDGHHHLTSTLELSTDEISHLLTLVAGRKIKTLSLLEEINVEASDLSTDINQKKIDLNMEYQIQLLEGENLEPVNDENITKIDVPLYQKVIKPYKPSIIHNKNNSNEALNTHEYDANFFEDLRTKVNDIANILVASNDSANSKFNDLSKEIKKKMDSSNIDRIISKIQNMLKKIQGEIEQIKSEKLFSSSQNNNKNRNTKSFDEKDFLFNSFSESRLISPSASIPLKSSQSSGIARPNTATSTSIMNKKIKKNYNEPNTQRKSKNNDLNNIPIIQKVSSGKLASSVVSNPKNYK